jgi:hypothetical protein
MAAPSKLRASMLVLTVLGALLMLPPLVYVFDQPVTHFGIPQIVFYLFAVWLLMIIGTAVLARALGRQSDEGDG